MRRPHVSRQGTDICLDSTVTATSAYNSTTPSTVEISGTTFTSGFAYLSYAGVAAYAGTTTCGTSKPAGILPLPSSDVSSWRGHDAAMPILSSKAWPFNFADLAPNPVPWDAWISQETCVDLRHLPQCQTITQAAYRPQIVYPSFFFSMEPEWSKCVSGIYGIVDPPTALPVAHAIAEATTPTAITVATTPAAPKTGLAGGLVRSTTAYLSSDAAVTLPTPESRKPAIATSRHSSVDLPSRHDPLRSSLLRVTEPAPEHTTAELQSSLSEPHLESKDPSTDTASGGPESVTLTEPTRETSFDVQSHLATTIILPTNTLDETLGSVGTLPVLRVSRTGVVSVGTDIVSEGQATTIDGTFISLDGASLVAGKKTTISSRIGLLTTIKTTNALSVLASAQTEASPQVRVTLGNDIFTVYSGGTLANQETTLELLHGEATTVDGQGVSFANSGVIIDASSFRFHDDPRTSIESPDSVISSRISGASSVEATYRHGASTMTLKGHVDPAGNTMLTLGSSRLTYTGQRLTQNGLAFSARAGHSSSGPPTSSTSGDPKLKTALPSIVTAHNAITSAPSPSHVVSQTLWHSSFGTSVTTSDALPEVAGLSLYSVALGVAIVVRVTLTT